MDKDKLAYAISAIWGMIAIPLSEEVYDVALDSGSFMRLFAFLLVITPVWLVLGWRWLTNKKPIPAKLWLGVSVLAAVWSIILDSEMYMDDIAIIPMATIVPFILLVWNFERGDMIWWRKKSVTHLFPSQKELIDGSTELISLTEELSNDLFKEIKSLAPNLKLPFPFDTTESLLCSYALIYMNLREKKFESATKMLAIFSGYKSLAMTNYAYISQPKIPGVKPLSGKELEQPGIKEPVKELFKMKEGHVEAALENISRNDPYPFYPIYESLRVFVSKDATPSQINSEFGPIFAKLNAKAKQGAITFINKASK